MSKARDAGTRCGILAAKAARSSGPGCRSSDDVLKLIRLIQCHDGFFAGFSPEVLEDVCQNLEYVPMLAKKTIFAEDKPAKYVYVVATGRVNLIGPPSLANKRRTLIGGPDGGEVPMNIDASGPGACHRKSRPTMQQRAQSKELADVLQEELDAQAKKEKSTELSPAQRFRVSIAAIRTLRQSSKATCDADTPTRIARCMEARRASKRSCATTLEHDRVFDIKNKGRLGVPLSSVFQDLAKQSAALSCQPKQDIFNSVFQSFGERVDLQLEQILAVDKKVEDIPTSPSPRSARSPKPHKKNDAKQRKADRNSPTQVGELSPADVPGQLPSVIAQDVDEQQPTTATICAGHIFGVHACMSGTTYDSTAKSLERCELLALPLYKLHAAVEKERQQRHGTQEQVLLSTVPSLRSIEREKLHRLTEHFRTSIHRRGAVLCWEGDVRIQGDEDDRVQFIVKGCAHTFKANAEAPQKSASSRRNHSLDQRDVGTLLAVQAGRNHPPDQRDVGTLLPGQVVNGASQFLSTAEPLTVIVHSAEAVVVSVSHADLARFGGSSVLDSVHGAVQGLHSWREERLSKLNSCIHQNFAEQSKFRDSEVLAPDDVFEQLNDWYEEKPDNIVRLAIEEEEHDGLSQNETLRGGLLLKGKPKTATRGFFHPKGRTLSVLPPKAAISESLRWAPKEFMGGEYLDWQYGLHRPYIGNTDLDDSFVNDTSNLKSAPDSSTDAMLWGSGILNCNNHEDSTFFHDSTHLVDHFNCMPRLSPFASQLQSGESGMRFPAGPMDPFHISTSPLSELSSGPLTAALPAERGQCGSIARSRMATAPTRRLPGHSDSLLCREPLHSSPLKPSTAPLPKIQPITPRDAPRMPPPRRWTRQVSSASGPAQEPDVSTFDSLPIQESSDLDHMYAEELYSTRLSSRQSHGRQLSSRGHLDSADLDLTIAPTSSEARPAPGRILAEDSLFLQRSMDSSSWDGADVTLMNSIDVAADPLAALYSKADLSTMADETSIWDHMWSVFGGSGPSESGEILDQSGEHIPFTMSWPESKGRTLMQSPSSSTSPAHKRCERQGDLKELAGRGLPGALVRMATLPGAHRPLKPDRSCRPNKALEAVAKQSLFESMPLHVHGIDRFLRPSTVPCAKRPLRRS